MAYNVNQLQQLQDMIGMEADVPNAIDRYNAMKLLQRSQTGVRREDGGQLDLSDEAQEIASKGRYGDTMLMHVTPDEVRGLSSARGGVTINPDTGLPEAFPWLPIAIGAGIGGIGSAVTGGDPLKGAAFGALGGAMPAALGGLAGVAGGGVLSAWNWLGPIGQGMLAGGAMGGIRSLFGDSDNPLRDIMLGATMGGVTGALFPETTLEAGAEGVGYGEQAGKWVRDTTGKSFGAVTPSSSPTDFIQTRSGVIPASPPPSGGINYITGRNIPVDAAVNIPTGIGTKLSPDTFYKGAGFEQVGSAGPDVLRPMPSGFGDPRFQAPPIAAPDIVSSQSIPWKIPPVKPSAPSRPIPWEIPPVKPEGIEKPWTTKVSDWWGRREPWQQAAIIGGTGLLASEALRKPPEQEELETDEIVAFPRLDPIPLQEPIQPLTEEQILAAYSGPSGTGIDTWFQPQVAKEGGLVELDAGGTIINNKNSDIPKLSVGTSGYMGDPAYRAGVRAGPGGAVYYPPGYSGPAYKNERGNLYWTSAKHDEPLPLAPAPPPPPPPEVTDPFVSNVSSFNVQDALSRITGQSAVPEQITLPTSSQLPALATSSQLPTLATAAQLPAGNIQQGASALSDLFSRFQQAQGDPIVDIVTATEAVPETTTAKEGGIIELYKGGPSSATSTATYGNYGGGASHAQTAAQTAAKSQAAHVAAKAAAAKLGLGPGSKSIVGSKGWTNVSSPTVTTQAMVNAGRLASNAAAKARGTLFGESLGQMLGWGLINATTLGTIAKAANYLGNPAGGRYSAQAHAAQFSPSLASMIGGAKGMFGIGGEGQTQTGEGQTQTGEGQADSGKAKSNPFTMFNPFAQQQREGGIVGLAAGGVFEGRVQGTGDGMADEVAFNVVPQTPADIPNTPDMALLSSDEYVIPADVVSMLGNGSSTAGAQALDQFNQIMRKKAHGTDKQQRELDAGKELSRLV